MSAYVTLMGAEDVSRAGYAMREAAHEMSRAAGNIDESFRNHQQFLDDWLQQLASIMATASAAAVSDHEAVGAGGIK